LCRAVAWDTSKGRRGMVTSHCEDRILAATHVVLIMSEYGTRSISHATVDQLNQFEVLTKKQKNTSYKLL
jgi:hypothetical protein